MKAINWAITAASAAPLIPKRAKGPIQKLKRISNCTGNGGPIKTTNIDKRVFPPREVNYWTSASKKRKRGAKDNNQKIFAAQRHYFICGAKKVKDNIVEKENRNDY